MEKELIDLQKEYANRRPKQNYNYWVETFTKAYESKAMNKENNRSNPHEAFLLLSDVRRESETKLNSLKDELDNYSKNLFELLIPSNKLKNYPEAKTLHHTIETTIQLGLTSGTLGNFREGGTNIEELYSMFRKYLDLTNQNTKKRQVIKKIPLAYQKRFLADMLYYKLKALDYLLERIQLFEYPEKIPPLQLTELERLQNFIEKQQSKKGRKTPAELYEDIFYAIKERINEGDEFLFINDKLNFNQVATLTLDPEVDKRFYEKWSKTKNSKNGITVEWLAKLVKKVYEGLPMHLKQ